MSKSRVEVRGSVVEALAEIAQDGENVQISDQTDPFNDLGLESIDGVLFACALSDKLGFYIPDNINPLVDDARQRARQVGEVVDFICTLLKTS